MTATRSSNASPILSRLLYRRGVTLRDVTKSFGAHRARGIDLDIAAWRSSSPSWGAAAAARSPCCG